MKIGLSVAVGLVLLCWICPPAAAGQEIYLLGGLTMANLGGDGERFGDEMAATFEEVIGGTWRSNKKMLVGIDIGIGFSYAGPGIVGAATELRYVTRGAEYTFDELDGGLHVESKMKLDYVEIPALLQLAPPTQGSAQFVFVAGPVIGIRASSHFESEVQGQSTSVDISDGMKSVYFAGLLGAGMKIRATEVFSLLLQTRFQLGFSNLIDDSNFSVRPQDFSIQAGYAIRL